MSNYYQKYLKYKFKYLNLKMQKGGNHFSLLTFNILLPHEKVNNITFKSLLKNLKESTNEEIKHKINTLIEDEKDLNNVSDILAIADKKRFEQREKIILDFINICIKNGTIVCLQEVSDLTLDKLRALYKNVICNTEDDILIMKTPKGENNYSRKEYRITIIPESYKILETNDLILDFENDKTKSRKNGVYTKIQDESEKIYHILNVHFHYLYDKDIINSKIDPIKKIIDLKEDEKIIIAGDTNKSLKDLDIFSEALSIQSNGQDESINTFLNQPEISKTPDHILTNFKGELKVLEKIEDKQIIYDEIMIINVINILLDYKGYFIEKKADYKKKIDESLVNLIFEKLSSINQYFSDHKPLLLT